MQSRLPLLPSGPGGVCKSTVRGPWRRQCGGAKDVFQGKMSNYALWHHGVQSLKHQYSSFTETPISKLQDASGAGALEIVRFGAWRFPKARGLKLSAG